MASTSQQGIELQDDDPSAILTSIEDLLLQLLEGLSQGRLPILQVPTLRRSVKRHYTVGESEELQPAIQISLTDISLTAKQGAGAFRYTRIIKMLTLVHELVRTARTAPQRDIYYQLKSAPLFTSPRQVSDALEDVSMLLGVPKHSLGVTSSSRGLVQGLLSVREGEDCDWSDCTSCRAITGDCAALQSFQFSASAKYVVIVEKDAVFQRLVEEDFHLATSCILVTARGMPDMATRLFLQLLFQAYPDLIFTAVVDWNPCGIAIMKTYKFGTESSLQGAEYSLPNLRWLAMHAEQVDCLPEDSFQPLSEHDRSVIRSLKKGPLRGLPQWLHEIQTIDINGVKAEIEAAYRHSGYGIFVRDLAGRLQEGLYIS